MMKNTGEQLVCRMGEAAACGKERLTDIRHIKVDKKLPTAERIRDYIYQVGDPYTFRVGDTAVKIEFVGGGELAESIARIMLAG